VDEKVRNILRMMLRLKMIGPERKHRKTGAYNTEEHRRAVLDVARESMILLGYCALSHPPAILRFLHPSLLLTEDLPCTVRRTDTIIC